MRELFDRMMRDPKIREGMERREVERRTRAAEAIARHGSVEALAAETPREAALRAACAPFVAAGRLDPNFPPSPSAMPADLVEAMLAAAPLPGTVVAALEAYDEGDRLGRDRAAAMNDVEPPVHVLAWGRLLERHLDTLPAATHADLLARLEWMQRVIDFGYSRDVCDDQACLDALRADIAAVSAGRIPLPGPVA